MRMCRWLGCDEAAAVHWHGDWCGKHADVQFGSAPMRIAQLETRGTPLQGHPVRLGPSSGVPSSGQAADEVTPSAPPAPLIEATDLMEIMDWDRFELEWALNRCFDILEDADG